MEMLSIRSVCGSVLAILYRKTLTTQGPCGTITTFDPQGMRLVPGRPDELYYLPERHDSEDQKQPVDAAKLNEVRQHVADPVIHDNQDIQEYLNYVCTSEGLESPLIGKVR